MDLLKTFCCNNKIATYLLIFTNLPSKYFEAFNIFIKLFVVSSGCHIINFVD